MLTIDDTNTILKKYGDIGFWYEIDFNKVDLASNLRSGKRFVYDFCTIYFAGDSTDGLEVTINNSSWKGQHYFKNSEGEIIDTHIWGWNGNTYILDLNEHTDVIMCLFISDTSVSLFENHNMNYLFVPQSDLVIPVIDGEFDDKLYITQVGVWDPVGYHINNQTVTLEEDSKGTFLRLSSAEDCFIGIINDSNVKVNMYKVFFREFKSLPVMSLDTIYRGTPQKLKLKTTDDTYIPKFQAYYQGRPLRDNIINLPYDITDYINIVVDLNDPNYVDSTVKLKVATELYVASTQEELETAITDGIQTVKVINNTNPVTITDIELTDITLIDSNIHISDSTLTNVTIVDSTFTDNGNNNITNTGFDGVNITSDITDDDSTYTNCNINECIVTGIELQYTGQIKDSVLTNSLIISDGIIEITDNTITGKGDKEYFPSHLYLTGDYTMKRNHFTLTGEWEEPAFNMCLIKATDDFNTGIFITDNQFDLNIIYDEEPTSTLYYNIVDDDKIKAVRL